MGISRSKGIETNYYYLLPLLPSYPTGWDLSTLGTGSRLVGLRASLGRGTVGLPVSWSHEHEIFMTSRSAYSSVRRAAITMTKSRKLSPANPSVPPLITASYLLAREVDMRFHAGPTSTRRW